MYFLIGDKLSKQISISTFNEQRGQKLLQHTHLLDKIWNNSHFTLVVCVVMHGIALDEPA